MKISLKISHLLNKIFNITQYEWPRVIFWFIIKALLCLIFVLSSTLLTATFLEKFHIYNLPFLYVLISWASIIWSITLWFFIEWIEKKKSLIWLSVFSIFLISIIWFINIENSFLFFWALIFFVWVAITQMMIILSLFIEDFFSPLESERTLPFVESAEPVWWIVAGAILAFWATSISLNWFFNIIIWALILLMFLFSSSFFLNKIPKLISKKEKKIENHNKIKKIEHWFRHIKWVKFLKSMTVIVFLQFALFSLIQFQYTSALDSSIKNTNISWEEVSFENHWETISKNNIENEEELHWVWPEHSYASELAHWLWFYHILFSALFFLTQIFLSGRLNKKFWIINTMAIHPFWMLIPSFWLFFAGLAPAIIAKASFEVLSWIHRTAYASSIYAVKESIRWYVKEFFEWIAKPFWTLIWTFILIILANILHWKMLYLSINIIIILLLLAMILLLLRTKEKYTLIAKKNISKKTSITSQLEAIEVLTQKWHKNSEEILWKMLHKNSIPEIKEKILFSLWELGSENSIPDILDFVESKNENIQISALKALISFKKIWKDFFSQSFTKNRVIKTLKKLFKSTKSKKIKSLIIKIFSRLEDQEIIPFILEIVEKSPDEIKASTIYTCRSFDDKNLNYYIEKYLKSENPIIVASTIISLWQFVSIKLKLTIIISKLLKSEKEDELLAIIYTLWEIKAEQEIPRLIKFLNSDSDKIRRVSAVALLKMDKLEAVDHVIKFILHWDKEIWKETKEMLSKIPEKTFKHIKNLIRHEVILMIKKTIEKTWTNILEEMDDSKLEDFIHFYYLIDEHNEIIKIKNIMNEKNI